MNENWNYRRGDIYLADLNPFVGSEQGGTRPVLLLQNNAGNFFLPHAHCCSDHLPRMEEN